MANAVGVQYQSSTAGIINTNQNISFDTILLADPSIVYSPSTQRFTLSETGIYIVSWWVSIQASSSRYASFAINYSGDLLQANSPNIKSLLSGSAVLNVSLPNQNISLVSTSSEAIKLGVETPIKANISIFKASSSEGLLNLLDGDTDGSLYGINSTPNYDMGQNAVALGNDTEASDTNSFACGDRSTASGTNSFACGSRSTASGTNSFACGSRSNASGNNSFACGDSTVASVSGSFACGSQASASGSNAHAQGSLTNASGSSSHAQGRSTSANSQYSSAAGLGTSTDGVSGAFVVGEYGGPDNITIGDENFKDYGFYVANGTGFNSKSIAASILRNGQAYAQRFNNGGADYGEMFETSDGKYMEPGYFVAFDGNSKIRKANSSDKLVLGVTSKTAGIVGNNDAFNWEGKFLKDKWGEFLYNEDHERILNPNYDDSKEFRGREQRCEWVVVGLLGQVLVRDDGSSIEGGYCRVSNEGIATISDIGYPVLKRIDDDQILIMFNSIDSFNHINSLYSELSLIKKELIEEQKKTQALYQELRGELYALRGFTPNKDNN